MLYKFTIIISFLTCIGLILHSYDSRKILKKKNKYKLGKMILWISYFARCVPTHDKTRFLFYFMKI